MSLLNDASLIVTPNAYKEGKLYSVIPSDGSGDLSVTRATTATRVNSAGLVELVPYNLAGYSEQFENAYWTKNSSTISANTTTAPNGTLTADTLNVTASAFSGVSRAISGSSSNYTLSIYAKKNTKNWLYFIDVQGSNTRAWFNLDTGTLGTVSIGYTATITEVGNGWYRCTLSNNNLQTLAFYQLGLADANNANTPASSGSAFIWGAQLVEGTEAKDYYPTETRLNIPRLDYSLGGCPSILVEPQRTNLALYSEQFNVSPWGTLGTVTITPNATTSPSGILNADLVLGLDGSSSVNQIITGTTGVVYTNSFYIKNNDSTQSRLTIRNTVTAVECNINWTGSVLSSITNITGTTTFQSVSNGWYRIISTYTALENPQRPRILPTLATNQSVYLWGAQLEAGAYATSYIPTTSASVTRNADVISKTGISSLIGQTEGTIFIDFDFNGKYSSSGIVPIVLYSSSGNEIYIAIKPDGFFNCEVYNGVVRQAGFNANAGSLGRKKIALSYKQNDFVLYSNGIQIGVDTFGTVPAMSNIYIGKFYGNNNSDCCCGINAAALWKERLTNDQLEALTGEGFDTYQLLAENLNYILQ